MFVNSWTRIFCQTKDTCYVLISLDGTVIGLEHSIKFVGCCNYWHCHQPCSITNGTNHFISISTAHFTQNHQKDPFTLSGINFLDLIADIVVNLLLNWFSILSTTTLISPNDFGEQQKISPKKTSPDSLHNKFSFFTYFQNFPFQNSWIQLIFIFQSWFYSSLMNNNFHLWIPNSISCYHLCHSYVIPTVTTNIDCVSQKRKQKITHDCAMENLSVLIHHWTAWSPINLDFPLWEVFFWTKHWWMSVKSHVCE